MAVILIATISVVAVAFLSYTLGLLSYPLWQDRKRRQRELDQRLFDRAVRR